MRHINLISAKGGQGVTTTAILLANAFVNQGQKVLLVDREDGELYSMVNQTLRIEDRGIYSVSSDDRLYLTVCELDQIEIDGFGFDVVISDGFDPSQTFPETENIIVTQPCYIALNRLVRSGYDKIAKGVIIVRPANRVLTDRDVASVANVPLIATIEMSPEVARASDAGILSTRRGGYYAVTLDENAVSR